MKPFELTYLCAEPFLLALYGKVRRRLLGIAKSFPHRPDILDVGGRKSHYTIGVPANITVTDLPRETEIQKKLGLGINQEIIDKAHSRRSNLHKILLDDMTHSTLPDCSFECVVSVEVLEHVEQDAQFVREVHRVLKPGGFFLMTTPNGDFVKNTSNPDHKRHYEREQLRKLLCSCFANVQVEYAVRDGYFHTLGLGSWSIRHPWRTVCSMTGNVVNSITCTKEITRPSARHSTSLSNCKEARLICEVAEPFDQARNGYD